jgi:hypothetical protein
MTNLSGTGPFYNKLGEDIVKYAFKVDATNEALREVKEFCINFLQKLLKEELSKNIILIKKLTLL